MARNPITDQWPQIRQAAEQGVPFKTLSAEYGVEDGTIRKRAMREQWLTPMFLQTKIAALSKNVSEAPFEAPPSLKKKEPDKDKTAALLMQSWDEKANFIRHLAYDLSINSLAGLRESGITVKDAGDAVKLIKAAREATGQFQDQPLVQMAVFNGANSGFDAETVQSDTVILEDGAEYETEM